MAAFQLLHSSYMGLGFLSGSLGTHKSESSLTVISSFFLVSFQGSKWPLLTGIVQMMIFFLVASCKTFFGSILGRLLLEGKKKSKCHLTREKSDNSLLIDLLQVLCWSPCSGSPHVPLVHLGEPLSPAWLPSFTAWISFWKYQSFFWDNKKDLVYVRMERNMAKGQWIKCVPLASSWCDPAVCWVVWLHFIYCDPV